MAGSPSQGRGWMQGVKGGEQEKKSFTTSAGDVYDVHDVTYKTGRKFEKGVITFANGDKYEGQWSEGAKNGHGKYVCANGVVYEGRWKDDCRHGFGTCSYSNGDKYKGKWKGNHKHGEGTYYFHNGNVYEGDWRHDRATGNGRCKYFNGDSYRGQWHNDRAHGKGIYSYSSGEEYDGNWVHGKKTGTGQFEFANGDLYKGEFLDDDIHGVGTKTFASGDRYVGEWKQGMRHGIGKMDWADGRTFNGTWEFDEPVIPKEAKKSDSKESSAGSEGATSPPKKDCSDAQPSDSQAVSRAEDEQSPQQSENQANLEQDAAVSSNPNDSTGSDGGEASSASTVPAEGGNSPGDDCVDKHENCLQDSKVTKPDDIDNKKDLSNQESNTAPEAECSAMQTLPKLEDEAVPVPVVHMQEPEPAAFVPKPFRPIMAVTRREKKGMSSLRNSSSSISLHTGDGPPAVPALRLESLPSEGGTKSSSAISSGRRSSRSSKTNGGMVAQSSASSRRPASPRTQRSVTGMTGMMQLDTDAASSASGSDNQGGGRALASSRSFAGSLTVLQSGTDSQAFPSARRQNSMSSSGIALGLSRLSAGEQSQPLASSRKTARGPLTATHTQSQGANRMDSLDGDSLGQQVDKSGSGIVSKQSAVLSAGTAPPAARKSGAGSGVGDVKLSKKGSSTPRTPRKRIEAPATPRKRSGCTNEQDSNVQKQAPTAMPTY